MNQRNDSNLSRRSVLARGLELAGLAAALGGLPAGRRALAQPPGGGPPPLPPGTHLVLLGTRGGPGVDLARGQTASAVIVDGVPYLFDCGYGTMRQLVASQVGFQRVSSRDPHG
jgi:hypothetical protein